MSKASTPVANRAFAFCASLRHGRVLSAVCFLLLLGISPVSATTGSEPQSIDSLPPYVLLWPDGIDHILVADADSSRLIRFDRSIAGQAAESMYMSVGQRGVGKQREGDRRTPLGVYFVTEQLDTSELDPIYGYTAFPLDYPNARDRSLERDGSGIWLHGVPPGNERRPARDTDGCLAIANDALAELVASIAPQQTPIIIARSVAAAPAAKRVEQDAIALEAAVRQWADRRHTGHTYAFGNLYADDFRRQGLDKTEWLALWADEPMRGSSRLSQLLIVADPEDLDVFVTRFRLDTDGVEAYKRLYWRRQSDGLFVIVAEDEW